MIKYALGMECLYSTYYYVINLLRAGCPYHGPEVTVQITPSGIIPYEGENVQLVCTAVAVEQHEQPFWWKEDANRSMTPCERPQYMLNNSFDKSACRWTTVLTIPSFSQENEGTYHCGVSNFSNNQTLHLKKQG